QQTMGFGVQILSLYTLVLEWQILILALIRGNLGGFRPRGFPCGGTGGAALPLGTQKSKVLYLYFRGIPGLSILPLPLSGLQPALDIDLVALGQVLFTDFRGLVPHHYIVPFGLAYLLTGLFVGIGLVGGQGKPAHTI